ncbi:MAG: hypothetical protein HOW73_19130 [Polyangiaceae bacterium]|nr:hypothetical protein [Polyangiaceae bacterium]
MADGIEHALRAPSKEELAGVAKRRATWHSAVKASKGSSHELLIPVVVAIAGVIIGVVIDNVPVIVAATAMGAVMLGLYVFVWRIARRAPKRDKGPWDLADGWRVRETTIRARAVIAAGSGDEDYATWLVLELDGSEWYAFEPSCLGDDPTGASLACAELVIASIEPAGAVLSARASGAPLPRRGGRIDVEGEDRIAAAGDAYAAMVEGGFVWVPEDAVPPAGGLVSADTLPDWMRDGARVRG